MKLLVYLGQRLMTMIPTLVRLVITAVLAPYLAPFPEDVSATHPAKRLRPPSWEHPFGTDTLGRDVYRRVLYGGRITLVISVTVVGACILIGVPAGLIAGYCDNIVGDVVMRLADIFLAVPRVILALALSQALGPSLPNMLLALTITYWPWFARTVAAETRSVKQSTFVEASEALGMRPTRIIFCHVLPNVLSPIIVRSTVGMGFTILTAAALAPNPALIIADEPTSALDVTVQAQILLLLKSLVKERGTSVFLITHDLGVVAKLCDRVAVMYAGQEVEVAPTAALFRHPSHPYTQKLLDSLPDRQQGEIQGIPGVVPGLIDPPRGCRFHTRCEVAMPICREERPPAVELFPDHLVRCQLFPPDEVSHPTSSIPSEKPGMGTAEPRRPAA
ncbi:MAG TPA: oligopeptide/dipeptide ABC transporter ATP-binding protein [Candidatus Tectomicrobia bacterium]